MSDMRRSVEYGYCGERRTACASNARRFGSDRRRRLGAVRTQAPDAQGIAELAFSYGVQCEYGERVFAREASCVLNDRV